MKTFCVKLKPLASNKCTLVPASMKRNHPPLTNTKGVSASPLPFQSSLDLLLHNADHRESSFFHLISSTSSSLPSLEIVMMLITNTVFRENE